MNTQAQQIDTKTTINVETLENVSFVRIDTETVDIVLNSEVIGYIIYTDSTIEINSDYTLTETELNIIEKKVNEFLGEPSTETQEEYTSYEEMYGVTNGMFI
jgi:hypothetical protein